VLARVDSALMRAEAAGAGRRGGPDIAADPVPGEGAWRELLEGALARHDFSLVDYPVLSCDGALVHREVMLRLRCRTREAC
jgi:hypothetical protein